MMARGGEGTDVLKNANQVYDFAFAFFTPHATPIWSSDMALSVFLSVLKTH